MTEVVFTKDAGRFKKDRVVDFPPALADFFVSKVRCAVFKEATTYSAKPSLDVEKKIVVAEDFSDVLSDDSPARTYRKNKIKAGRYSNGHAHKYTRRDMQAEV